jgi:hypothetical protein
MVADANADLATDSQLLNEMRLIAIAFGDRRFSSWLTPAPDIRQRVLPGGTRI